MVCSPSQLASVDNGRPAQGAAAQLRPAASEPALGGGDDEDLARLYEEARPSPPPSPGQWLVSWIERG